VLSALSFSDPDWIKKKLNGKLMQIKCAYINNKCINSKNKAKGFWEMLRDNKTNVTPSQIIDPVNYYRQKGQN
jgi:hypothetical protein